MVARFLAALELPPEGWPKKLSNCTKGLNAHKKTGCRRAFRLASDTTVSAPMVVIRWPSARVRSPIPVSANAKICSASVRPSITVDQPNAMSASH
jgi:hypothetical protein